MAIITPKGKLRLCTVPIDASYKDTLKFTNIENQTSYFASKAVYNFDDDDYTFMQKDGVIRVNKNADQLYKCNYVMYQNSQFGGKWFYAFVTRVEWGSDQMSLVHIETDVLQTWQFEWLIRPSFVVREHTLNDVAGNNLLDENVDLGEYINISKGTSQFGFLSIVIATTVTQITKITGIWNAYDKVISDGGVYQGIYAGNAYWGYPVTEAGISDLNAFLNMVTEAGATEVVSAIFMCPTIMLQNSMGGKEPNSWQSKRLERELDGKPSTIDGYTPKNKKLLTHPYITCYVHNNSGSAAIYPFEYFSNGVPKFEIFGTVHGNPTFKLVPINYKGEQKNNEESLTLSGFPLCSWTYDTYKAWLAQHGASTAIGTATALLATAAGVVSGNIGILGGGVLGVMSQIAKWKEIKAQPPQSQGNAISAAANVAGGVNDFFFIYKTITAEYAKIIDDYFSMYGYKTNRTKLPNLTGRAQWNFVQVTDLNMVGDIPSPDMVKIKNIFQQGVTFWHNPSNVGNYALSNEVS